MAGQRYYLRYSHWHTDPRPFLYIVHADRDYTEGFNLHYLPNIRFRIPVDKYRAVNDSVWAKAYDNMRKAGMFYNFLALLDKAGGPIMDSNGDGVPDEVIRNSHKFKAMVTLISDRYPWAMESYRKYHSRNLSIRRDIK